MAIVSGVAVRLGDVVQFESVPFRLISVHKRSAVFDSAQGAIELKIQSGR